MNSVEKYLTNFIVKFFENKKIESNNVSKEIFDYIILNSNIHFENLYVKCSPTQSGFSGFIAAKCTPKKIEFEIYIKK